MMHVTICKRKTSLAPHSFIAAFRSWFDLFDFGLTARTSNFIHQERQLLLARQPGSK